MYGSWFQKFLLKSSGHFGIVYAKILNDYPLLFTSYVVWLWKIRNKNGFHQNLWYKAATFKKKNFNRWGNYFIYLRCLSGAFLSTR